MKTANKDLVIALRGMSRKASGDDRSSGDLIREAADRILILSESVEYFERFFESIMSHVEADSVRYDAGKVANLDEKVIEYIERLKAPV